MPSAPSAGVINPERRARMMATATPWLIADAGSLLAAGFVSFRIWWHVSNSARAVQFVQLQLHMCTIADHGIDTRTALELRESHAKAAHAMQNGCVPASVFPLYEIQFARWPALAHRRVSTITWYATCCLTMTRIKCMECQAQTDLARYARILNPDRANGEHLRYIASAVQPPQPIRNPLGSPPAWPNMLCTRL